MADAPWYYARDNQEHGPVTTAQLKALLKKGEVEPSSLIWKEGMQNWQPAEEVPEIFEGVKTPNTAVFRPADSNEPVNPKDAKEPDPPRKKQAAVPQPVEQKSEPIDLTSYGRWGGYGIVLLSLLAMVSMRGCASVASKNETRLQAQLENVRAEFDRPLHEKTKLLTSELAAINPGDTFSEDRRNELVNELSELTSNHADQKAAKEAGEWGNLHSDITAAKATSATIAFYTEFGFVFGSVALLLGLFAVAVFGDPPQRWVSLIMIAILLYGMVGFGGG